MSVIKVPQQVAMTIAGSDPSGGAGIQADLKTFTMVGVYGGAVITCLTAQNTNGVFAVQTVDPPFVKHQIETVLSDLDVTHIKIGMLGSAAVANCTCEALADFKGEIICDPVQLASSGQELIDEKGYDVVRTKLLDICTVITPNLPELSKLTGGQNCESRESLLKAAEILLQRHEKLRAVIITGGHFKAADNSITDYLFSFSPPSRTVDCLEVSHSRIASSNTHGTGCTFSAAFTAYHLLTGDDSRAFYKTTKYMNAIIKKSTHFKIGHGTGPLLHHLR